MESIIIPVYKNQCKLRLNVNQVAITVVEHIKAQGVGFDSSSHGWGFLGLLIVGLTLSKREYHSTAAVDKVVV